MGALLRCLTSACHPSCAGAFARGSERREPAQINSPAVRTYSRRGYETVLIFVRIFCVQPFATVIVCELPCHLSENRFSLGTSDSEALLSLTAGLGVSITEVSC